MKKERMIAAIIGAILGIVLAVFLLLRTNTPTSDIKIKKEKAEKSEGGVLSSTPTVEVIKGIKVLSPKDFSVVKENKVELSFEIPRESLVVVASPVFEKAVYSKGGKINMEVGLAAGENVIKIYTYPVDPMFAKLDKEIVVYYLKQEL